MISCLFNKELKDFLYIILQKLEWARCSIHYPKKIILHFYEFFSTIRFMSINSLLINSCYLAFHDYNMLYIASKQLILSEIKVNLFDHFPVPVCFYDVRLIDLSQFACSVPNDKIGGFLFHNFSIFLYWIVYFSFKRQDRSKFWALLDISSLKKLVFFENIFSILTACC